jgi:hypothetical protein
LTSRDHRWLARVECDLPGRILTNDGWVPVVVRDLSRTGLRVTFDPVLAGIEPAASLSVVARRLGLMLPEYVPIELHHRRLGLLVTREVRVVRLPRGRGRRPDIQLGCTFRQVLTDDEVAALGVALPHVGETAEEALRRQPPRPPTPRRPSLSTDGPIAALQDLFGDLDGNPPDEDPPAA